jgi:hypothetical protein
MPRVFTHPYRSEERKYQRVAWIVFPKDINLDKVSQNGVISAMIRLNWRLIEYLDFQVLFETFVDLTSTQKIVLPFKFEFKIS